MLRFDAEDLRLFTLVYSAGSLSAAERRFGITKSRLSRSLARVESEAGLPLFDRLSTGLKPTALAIELAEESEVLSTSFTSAVDTLRGAKKAPAGKLVVAASAASSRFLLTEAIANYLELYPKVDFDLKVTSSAPDPLAEEIDLSIQVGRPKNQSLVARRIFEGPTGLFAAKDSQVDSVEAVLELGRVVISGGDTPASWRERWGLFKDGEEIEISGPPIASVGDPAIAVDLIAKGRGVTLLPLFYEASSDCAGRIERVLPDLIGPPLELFAVFPEGRRHLPTFRCFLELLLESVGRKRRQTEPESVV